MIEATLESYGSPFEPLMSLNAAIGEDRKSPSVNAEPPKEGAYRSTRVAEVLAGAPAILPGALTRVSNLGNQHDLILSRPAPPRECAVGPCYFS